MVQFGTLPKDRRRVISEDERREVVRRQGDRCANVGDCSRKITAKTMQADHTVPYSWGGVTTIGNTNGLCKICHKKRTSHQKHEHLFDSNPLGAFPF